MTNTEYEKASVNAATGQALLEKCDATIQSLERALVTAQEERREIVNRYNLNKPCEHDWARNGFGVAQCLKCEAFK